MFVKVFLGTIALICLIRWLWSRRDLYRLAWRLNGPWSLPLIGHIYMFTDQEEILNVIVRNLRKFTGPITLWLGPDLYVMLDHPEDIETVLSSQYCLRKANIYKLVKSVLETDGLVTNQDAVWKKHRRLIGQGFSENVVNGYMGMFNKHIGDLVTAIGNEVGNEPFNLKTTSNVYLMNTILETTLGHDVEEDDKHTYEKFFSDAQNIVSKKVYQPWYNIELYWRFTKWPAVLKAFNVLHNKIFDKLIVQRLEQGCDRLTLIDKLLRHKEETEEISISEIKGECNTIMMAGSDTSALTVATTILMLAMHPQYQQRVYEEISGVLGHKNDAPLDREQIGKLVFTERCIRETMRFIPMVPIIARTNSIPIKLRTVDIPAGSQIAICIDALHKNTEHWGSDALEYVPDRFLPERMKNVHPYAFLGFSGGPRNCIGYKYAIVIVKLAVARLVQSYKFTTPLQLSDVRYSVDINVRFLMKHLVQVERRT